MNLTDYHAKYYAHELTKRCASDSIEKLAGALVDAQVDLNPHQVDAALFAFRSPLSKGGILADEVGLGKTIEAGLVIAQHWAERHRRILIITPANLRKQWHQELQEKFFLSSIILESKSYNEAIKNNNLQPFESGKIIICSYQFARGKAADVNAMPWDLVVIDEAHRLRNVYKPSNVTANTLKQALIRSPKLLLTATPLQNSLLELYGLVSFIDEHTFGDLKSFREQYANLSDERTFAAPICCGYSPKVRGGQVSFYLTAQTTMKTRVRYIRTGSKSMKARIVSLDHAQRTCGRRLSITSGKKAGL